MACMMPLIQFPLLSLPGSYHRGWLSSGQLSSISSLFLYLALTVASTIGKGMIDVNTVTPTVIFAGLIGAISWNLITWYFGLPSSSSHALIGGYAGAAIAKSGLGVIIAERLVQDTALYCPGAHNRPGSGFLSKDCCQLDDIFE